MAEWTKADSEELRKLADNATPGEWDASISGATIGVNIGGPSISTQFGQERVAWVMMSKDADFIIASRTAVPRLLDYVEELDENNDDLKNEVRALKISEGLLMDAISKLRAVVVAAKTVSEKCICALESEYHVDDLREALSALEKDSK